MWRSPHNPPLQSDGRSVASLPLRPPLNASIIQRVSPAPTKALTCGEDVVGFVEVTGIDNYWTIGTFEPGRRITSTRAYSIVNES